MLKITTEDNQSVGEVGEGWTIADITPIPVLGSNAGGVGGINIDSVARERASRLPGSTLFVDAGELGEATCYTTSVNQSPNGTVSLDLATEFKALDVEIEAPIAFSFSELQRVQTSSYATSISADHDGYWLSLGPRDFGSIRGSTEPNQAGVVARYDNAGNFLYAFDGTNGSGGYVTSVAGANSAEWKAGARMITVRHAPGYSYPTGRHYIEVFEFTTSATPPAHVLTIDNGTGTGDGQFTGRYIAVAMDEANRVYVGDAADRIQVFNPSGTFRTKFGTSGTGNNQFQGIQALVVFPRREGTTRTVAVLEYTPTSARVHQVAYNDSSNAWSHFDATGQITYLQGDNKRADRFFRPCSMTGAGGMLYVYDAGGPAPRLLILNGDYSGSVAEDPGVIMRPRGSADSRSMPQVTTTYTVEDSPATGPRQRAGVIYVLDGLRPGAGSDYAVTKYNAPFLTNPRDVLEAYIRRTPYAGKISFVATSGQEIKRDISLYDDRYDFATISWKGNAWQNIKDFCAVHGILISAATGVINFQWQSETPDSDSFLDISNAQGFRKAMTKQSSFAKIAADNLRMKKIFSSTEPIYSAKDDTNRIIQFGVNTVLSLRLGEGNVYIPNPRYDDFDTTIKSIEYTVIDSQGIECTAAFLNYGGSVTISVTEPGYFNLNVRGPVIALPGTVGPYAFAKTGDAAAQNTAVHPALIIRSLGLVTDPIKVSMGTGIIADRASSDSTDISRPFLSDAGLTYGAMSWVAARSGQEQQQINFNLPWKQGMEMGKLAGAKIRYENATYIVSSVSFNAGRVSIGAERYTQQSEVEALWSGSSANDFDTHWQYRKALDATLTPLETE